MPKLRDCTWESVELLEWVRSTEVMLGQIFPPRKDDDLDWYIDSEQVRDFRVMERDKEQWIHGFESDLQSALNSAEALLRSIIDVDLRPVAIRQSTSSSSPVAGPSGSLMSKPTTDSKTVFIVHGRDDDATSTVSTFVNDVLRRKPTILKDAPGRGRTIIEKFEDHAKDADYAIVLMTADDEGALKGEVTRPRARQNVIFELGFFVRQVGRRNVCALTRGGPERPSDYDGVEYIAMEDADWKEKLIRELKAAGLTKEEPD